jgi:hypothetical protein
MDCCKQNCGVQASWRSCLKAQHSKPRTSATLNSASAWRLLGRSVFVAVVEPALRNQTRTDQSKEQMI